MTWGHLSLLALPGVWVFAWTWRRRYVERRRRDYGKERGDRL